MIISFKNKFVFVAIPKTAGHSIRHALRPALASNDWEQCTLFEKRYFPVARLATKGHGHIGVAEIQPYLLPGQWGEFFSFAFVRNPFDRFASFCAFYRASDDSMDKDPLGTMKSMAADPVLRKHVLMQPQITFLRDASGEIGTSFVGRYETLQRDFDTICDQASIRRQDLARVNASSRERLAAQFDEALREELVEIYQEDFTQFGYSEVFNDDMAQTAE